MYWLNKNTRYFFIILVFMFFCSSQDFIQSKVIHYSYFRTAKFSKPHHESAEKYHIKRGRNFLEIHWALSVDEKEHLIEMYSFIDTISSKHSIEIYKKQSDELDDLSYLFLSQNQILFIYDKSWSSLRLFLNKTDRKYLIQKQREVEQAFQLFINNKI
ncbi:hypothetical protein [Flammeovirga sp. SJP92]|uniref:hypothetical protein n=1 Tax=Flammeovirga sp. SJP92 TaxID=1775430 RepID=UPI000786AF47|nr:hypothetical protein [Flammeovirga sp. SJP92]KXX69505.1 hypothetical protein AVL50_15650 [Flammeovirga sp. SJP92]